MNGFEPRPWSDSFFPTLYGDRLVTGLNLAPESGIIIRLKSDSYGRRSSSPRLASSAVRFLKLGISQGVERRKVARGVQGSTIDTVSVWSDIIRHLLNRGAFVRCGLI